MGSCSNLFTFQDAFIWRWHVLMQRISKSFFFDPLHPKILFSNNYRENYSAKCKRGRMESKARYVHSSSHQLIYNCISRRFLHHYLTTSRQLAYLNFAQLRIIFKQTNKLTDTDCKIYNVDSMILTEMSQSFCHSCKGVVFFCREVPYLCSFAKRQLPVIPADGVVLFR